LISALIWHPKSGRGIIMRLPRLHRRQEVKNPPRGPMLFAARGREALLIMPRPFLRCQNKAEIKGFLLMYSMFLYLQWFSQNSEKGWRKIFEEKQFRYYIKIMKWKKNKKTLVFSNFLKEPLLVQNKTIHQQKALDFSFNLTPWKWAWNYQKAVTPSRREKHILLNFMAARQVFDFLISMTSLEVKFRDTSTFKMSN
jgi:hypothetical protein